MTLMAESEEELIPRMSTFTLTIYCLTTSNLPWFIDLTFQVPMQYCSLQHYFNHLSHPQLVLFCFSSVSSFFPELFLHSCPVTYWAPTDLGSSSFSVLSFCLFILFIGFSMLLKVFAIPFSSGPRCVRTLHHDLSVLGGPSRHGP